MTDAQRAEALRLADEFGCPFPEPDYGDLAAAAALLRELAAVPAEPAPAALAPSEVEMLKAEVERLRALAMCECGDEFSERFRGQCFGCQAADSTAQDLA